ncbi:hypothetical protein OSB04_025200 [Centaurea solstitialis]|uniref:Uncharacterized protein n=1 Tax=Centaurea solstitialis TaxID=347529 RepID=A0AA38SV81_9ASTR|nr:hypothetical protein OSB04_025200 [Centaurea solstitialis]
MSSIILMFLLKLIGILPITALSRNGWMLLFFLGFTAPSPLTSSSLSDNKGVQVVDLENQFDHIRLDIFPTVTAYCQQLKKLVDQLKDVDETVSGQRLVLQLILQQPRHAISFLLPEYLSPKWQGQLVKSMIRSLNDITQSLLTHASFLLIWLMLSILLLIS